MEIRVGGKREIQSRRHNILESISFGFRTILSRYLPNFIAVNCIILLYLHNKKNFVRFIGG